METIVIADSGATIQVLNRKIIQWVDGPDIIQITRIGSDGVDPIWLITHIDVTEGGYDAESRVVFTTELYDDLRKLQIPLDMVNKINLLEKS